MPGTNTQLTPLAVRKQLLLVESEVNRAQLRGECASLKSQVGEWTHSVHSAVDCCASAVAAGQEALALIRDALSGHGRDKPSLLFTVIKGVRLGSSLWKMTRECLSGWNSQRNK